MPVAGAECAVTHNCLFCATAKLVLFRKSAKWMPSFFERRPVSGIWRMVVKNSQYDRKTVGTFGETVSTFVFPKVLTVFVGLERWKALRFLFFWEKVRRECARMSSGNLLRAGKGGYKRQRCRFIAAFPVCFLSYFSDWKFFWRVKGGMLQKNRNFAASFLKKYNLTNFILYLLS